MSVFIRGKVVRGEGKGKTLGFPTANVEIEEKIESGVYAGVALFDSRKYKAGIFVKGNLLEAHIIGFSGDLYGKEISVEIIRKLREIKKFENEEELVRQIKRDIGIISNS